METVKVIGAGLAGVEASLYLANHGVKVMLYDIKPSKKTPAHHSDNFAELVCSNSLKSNDVYGNASGLMKEELRMLGSKVIEIADKTKVPAGNALAVDREKFSNLLTELVKSNENITFVSQEVVEIDSSEYTIVATGPLTTDGLYKNLQKLVKDKLSFYDASAPIITKDSIDMNSAFFGDRYGKGDGDHINCPMTKEEYETFISELLTAERAKLHDFEKKEVFEGCMPIEVMASRGKNTLRFGPLKPTGLDDPKTGRWPYACLQLRKEDEEGTMYNMVGFQTNLTFKEQKRVFGIIPALKNAEYLRYGVMHRNTFINAPELLNKNYSLIKSPKTFFAGQITGVEGYVESIGVGLMSAIYVEREIKGKEQVLIGGETVLGALAEYLTTPNKNFQPMNANFGILPALENHVRDKSERKRLTAERSLNSVAQFIKEINNGRI